MTISRRGAVAVLGAAAFAPPALAQQDQGYAEDARALIDLIFENYAYPERLRGFPEQRLRTLRESEAQRVTSARELVGFGERALAALFDHHAILNSSRADSYALVPSYADLWIEANAGDRYVIEDVRQGTPAAEAGLAPGDVLVGVDGAPMAQAIGAYIGAPAAALTRAQASVCARVLAAGRRDRARRLTITRGRRRRTLALANCYQQPIARGEGGVSVRRHGDVTQVRFNDSLGDDALCTGFPALIREAADTPALVLDLRDTASGGNSSVARAVMGCFIDEPQPYQRHELPEEQRRTGVRRSWIEEVSPLGARYGGRVVVLVGRWTGSMGEGMAMGFDAIGAPVIGSRMAGLLGAIYDLPLPHSGIVLKLPVERLAHVNGAPRERYAPPHLLAHADALVAGRDAGLEAALARAGG
ncbi:MAG: hypothetical protein JNK94_09540 [Hyphomonadaceae bacterium]|nr:hypothetical protein [Hyphomonadaceae bacterium]MBX3511062.1 hypothetical protein [Hyphomonadaceae bacterium]